MARTPRGFRKRLRHFHEPGDLHELTFSTCGRRQLLTRSHWFCWLSESIDRSGCNNHCRLVAFVYMPEYLHLLIDPVVWTDETIGRYLGAVKRPVSSRAREELARSGSPLLQQLTVQERSEKSVFRFWQVGTGYDRNLRGESAVMAAIDYIHANPVRRGLTDSSTEWKWSSARWYASDGRICDPDLPVIHGLRKGTF
jgi:putative transposase